MGEHDPTGELGKVGEIVPDITDPDADLSDEERQEIVSFTTPFNTRFSLTDKRPRSANYYGNLI